MGIPESARRIDGIIRQVSPVETFASGFKRRTFLLDVPDPRFPQTLPFSLTRDRVGLIDPYSPGDAVTVTFDIRGREYNGRHFVDLNAWRIDRAVAETASPPPAPPPAPAAPPAPAVRDTSSWAPTPVRLPPPAEPPVDPGVDDLPF